MGCIPITGCLAGYVDTINYNYAPANCAPLQTTANTQTLKDTLTSDSNGDPAYRTAYDGQLRKLTQSIVVGSGATESSSWGTGIETLDSSGGIPTQTIPSCVMLDQMGLVTPPKDQGPLGTCTIFASVGAIEAEYLKEYGVTLDLSEQYLINMMNETRPPDWAGGGDIEKLTIASVYGLPLESQWPYVNSPYTWQSDITWSLSSSLAYSDLENLMWSNTLDRDIANYSSAIYPTVTANREAVYGPTPGAIAAIANNGDDTGRFEAILAQGHTIAFMTVVGRWLTDPKTGVIGYNPSGTDTGGHSVILVGYDHSRQVFRIKNSWSASWNGNGFAEISYELFLKTAQGAQYVTAVKDPSKPQAGTGIWRGFWSVPSSSGGAASVAVIYHAFTPEGPINSSNGCGPSSCVNPDAVDVYGQDGSKTAYPDFIAGDASSATFGSGSSSFTLQISQDGLSATYTNHSDGATSTWRRCRSTAGLANLNPMSYPQALWDNSVLPPCAAN